MDELTAQDVMTRDVVTVGPTTSVKDIARTLYEKRISGLPVVDEEGRVLGIVTEDDLVLRVAGAHLPPHIELLGGIIYLENPLHLEEKLRKAMGVTAQEIMTPDPVTVDANAAVSKVANLMVRKKIDRVPVVENDRLVGIITRHDVISTLVRE